MNIQDRIGKFLQPNRTWFIRNVNTIKALSVHHDAIPHDNRIADEVMKQIMNGHVAQGWPGASYHYYIHRDGLVYQMNKHEWVTWIDGINWDALGIVLNGYFHPDINNKPMGVQLKSLKELLDELCIKHPEFPASQKDVLAHRERAKTVCNGNLAYPYVKEYREKLGDVSWGVGVIPPVTPPSVITDENQKVRVLGTDLTLRAVNELLTHLRKVEGRDTNIKGKLIDALKVYES